MNSDKIVSVYGYGRFGKLWTEILDEDFHVKVYSRSGIATAEVKEGIEITDAKGIFDCDALFFCVAISSFEEVLKHASPFCKTETLFFDTCSVKVLPATWMKQHLPQGCKIICTHPMFGPDSYPAKDKPLAMVMSNISSKNEEFQQWFDYFSSKSLHVEQMTPEKHDQLSAYSQGITHYVGRLFEELQLTTSPIDTQGYRSLLQVMEQTCNDSWQLFLDLQRYNPYTERMRQDLHNSIEKLNSALRKQR